MPLDPLKEGRRRLYGADPPTNRRPVKLVGVTATLLLVLELLPATLLETRDVAEIGAAVPVAV